MTTKVLRGPDGAGDSGVSHYLPWVHGLVKNREMVAGLERPHPRARDRGIAGVSFQSSSPTPIGDARSSERADLCAFVASAEDEFKLLLPYLRDGLERGDQVFEVLDPARVEDHLRRLGDAGIDTERYRGNGQLELRTWNDVYHRDGAFVPDAEAAVLADARARAARASAWLPSRLVRGHGARGAQSPRAAGMSPR